MPGAESERIRPVSPEANGSVSAVTVGPMVLMLLDNTHSKSVDSRGRDFSSVKREVVVMAGETQGRWVVALYRTTVEVHIAVIVETFSRFIDSCRVRVHARWRA